MTNKVLAAAGGPVHYYVDGVGEESIVFTHGATMDHDMFRPQMDYFKHKYTVISWDVPCHGQSRPYQGFTLKKAAHDILRVLDQEGVHQAHFVGQSMGGYVSQEVYLTARDRARSLAMIGSNPFGHEYLSWLEKWILKHIGSLQVLFPYRILVDATAKNISATKESLDYARTVLSTLSKREIMAITKVVYDGFLEHTEKSSIAVPLLIMYGEHDRTGKTRSYCRRWAKEEDAILKIIPRAAHNANLDNPGETNKVLEEFWNTNRWSAAVSR